MLIDFWAILIFAIILLLFFILFAVNKTVNDKKVQEQFINKDLNFMLESFLRAPVIGDDDSSKTIGEIIVEDSIRGDFDRSEKLFKEYFKRINQIDNQNIVTLELNIEGDYEEKISFEKEDKDGTVYILYAETYVPGYTKKVYVKLGAWTIFKPLNVK